MNKNEIKHPPSRFLLVCDAGVIDTDAAGHKFPNSFVSASFLIKPFLSSYFI